MKRYVSLEEISDGKRYRLNDMVRAGCHDCEGCSACCRGMGGSIILDPLDMFRLSCGTESDVKTLLSGPLELQVVDGLILPNMKMDGEEERCVYLNQQGRCSVHAFRPGICRLFPLGRYYEDGDFWYFLQVHECKKENRTKVKVRQWIDTPDEKRYERFVRDWHYFLKRMEELTEGGRREELAKNVNMYLLTRFYLTPFEKEEDFYMQFNRRLEAAELFAGRL